MCVWVGVQGKKGTETLLCYELCNWGEIFIGMKPACWVQRGPCVPCSELLQPQCVCERVCMRVWGVIGVAVVVGKWVNELENMHRSTSSVPAGWKVMPPPTHTHTLPMATMDKVCVTVITCSTFTLKHLYSQLTLHGSAYMSHLLHFLWMW